LVSSNAAAAGGHKPRQPSLTVVGTGFASARPDLLVFEIGVESQAHSATVALDDNSRRMTRL